MSKKILKNWSKTCHFLLVGNGIQYVHHNVAYPPGVSMTYEGMLLSIQFQYNLSLHQMLLYVNLIYRYKEGKVNFGHIKKFCGTVQQGPYYCITSFCLQQMILFNNQSITWWCQIQELAPALWCCKLAGNYLNSWRHSYALYRK